MIAARQIAFGKAAGGNKLPDGVVQVEYLESTGTQWIDTGVIPSSTCKFVDDCWRVKPTQFGSLNSGILRFHAFRPFCVGYDYLDSNTFYPYGSRTVVTLDNKHGVFDFNSTSCEFTPQQEPGAPTFVLFARNFAGTIDKYDTNCKMYGFKWWNDADEDITLDLIPVRVGNVGYMYDKVSGKLFRNQGTGDFVLGPDIIDYTDDDYPKDGIIVMWDGIKTKVENGCWYDSIGKRELTLNGGFTKTDNGVRFARSQYGECEMSDAINAILAGSFTIEFVVTFHEVTTNVGGIITFGTTEDTSSSRLLNIWGGGQGDNKFFGFVAYRSSSYVSADSSAPINIPVSVSFVANGSSAYLYVNNVFMKQIPSKQVTVATTQMFSLNRAWTVGREGQSATYHNVRMYTRALSEQERQWTYLIDKARFGL